MSAAKVESDVYAGLGLALLVVIAVLVYMAWKTGKGLPNIGKLLQSLFQGLQGMVQSAEAWVQGRGGPNMLGPSGAGAGDGTGDGDWVVAGTNQGNDSPDGSQGDYESEDGSDWGE